MSNNRQKDVQSNLSFKLPSTVLAHELSVRRVPKPMQFQFVRAWERLPAVRAGVGLRVERPGMPSCVAVRVKRLVTPWTREHPGDRVGVGRGMRS